MKQSLLFAFAACSIFNSLSASVYTTDFGNFDQTTVAGQDGWTTNATTGLPVDYDAVGESNIDLYNPATSNVMILGDASFVATPPIVSSVRLSHDYSGSLKNTEIGFDFFMTDSFTGSGYLNRDQFGVSLSNGNTDIFTLLFTPRTQTLDPSAGAAALWDVDYRIGVGPVSDLNISFKENARLHLDLSFAAASATRTDVLLSLRYGTALGEVGNASTVAVPNINMPISNPDAMVDEFNFFWTKQEAQFGSNYIMVDNLSVVPEPSSAILLSLAGLCLISRRRRS